MSEVCQKLITLIETEFDDVPRGMMTESVLFKDVIGWSSINSVVLVTVVEFEFGILLTTKELNAINTVGELAGILESKISLSGKL